MKKIVVCILVLIIPISGCAMFSDHETEDKLDSLERRVAYVERRQASIEDTVKQKDDTLTYVSETQVQETEIIESKRPPKSKKDVQKALKNAGYYNGKIDGKLGPKSKSAIKQFQADHGLKADGVAGAKTKQALAAYMP